SRERPALWCPDFPRRRTRRRGHPACAPNSTAVSADSLRPCKRMSHSGQRTSGPSCRTNSPHTGHSSEARCRGASVTSRSGTGNAGASASWMPRRAYASELPEHPHDLAEDLHVLRVDRLERAVLRLQPDAALLAVERLDRRLVRGLVVACER